MHRLEAKQKKEDNISETKSKLDIKEKYLQQIQAP
jgi:hypothetical protein